MIVGAEVFASAGAGLSSFIPLITEDSGAQSLEECCFFSSLCNNVSWVFEPVLGSLCLCPSASPFCLGLVPPLKMKLSLPGVPVLRPVPRSVSSGKVVGTIVGIVTGATSSSADTDGVDVAGADLMVFFFLFLSCCCLTSGCSDYLSEHSLKMILFILLW